MKVAQINTSCGVGSTGKICVSISKLLNERNVENYILYSAKTNGYEWGISCSNKKYIKFQALKSKLFGNYGLNSANATKRMISELNRIQPDIVHLHNIHGHDCNLEMLLEYLKRSKVKVYWTFHDCWTFTGYCPYYVLAQCDKWKSECKHCVLRKKFSFIRDRSTELHERKKKAFSGLDMTIITPSMWLANEVKKSFLAHYPIKVINNGIDLNIFHEADNDFRKKYGIENKR